MPEPVRDSPLAGRFFPAHPGELSALVDRLVTATRPSSSPPAGQVRALVVPHAGLPWSGPTAAAAYACLAALPAAAAVEPSATRVLLIGPSHFVHFRGVAVAPYRAYRTPLGEVLVDREVGDRLVGHGAPFADVPEAHAGEHALEVQLPFLQRTLPGARLVPLLCGADLHPEDLLAAAEVLAAGAWSDQTLLVASSDFTHYGASFGYTPFPAEQAAERIGALDAGAIQAVLDADADRFFDYVRQTRATICGRLAIGLMLRLLRLVMPDLALALVGYERSADRPGGDYAQRSVSYAAIVGRQPSRAESGG